MPGDKPRVRATAGDMVRSLILVLVVVAVILLLNARDERATVVRNLDFAGSLTQARQAASYDVLGPVGLGQQWRATSVRLPREGGGLTWHIGFVTPRGDYAGLEQSDGPPPGEFVGRFAKGSRATGDVRIAGRTWQQREGGKPEPRALVLEGKESTVVVAGSARWSELEALAGSLAGG
ncbi:MAG: DUF4245 domain-containing protein [Sporichthyaceae bacterium]